MSTNSDPRLKSLKPHPLYFHSGGDVTIIIGDVAFRVASVFFTRESPIFRDRLESKANDNAKAQKGPVDTIVIEPGENVSADDFAKLCWVFYNEKYAIYETPLATWETILRLANQYQFSEVKDLAFRQLSIPEKFNLPLVDRIVLYRKYAAESKYLEPLYIELLSRAESLALDEGNALGMSLALLISGARERLRAASDKLGPTTRIPDSMKDAVLKMAKRF